VLVLLVTTALIGNVDKTFLDEYPDIDPELSSFNPERCSLTIGKDDIAVDINAMAFRSVSLLVDPYALLQEA
jgi:hypothetical protein